MREKMRFCWNEIQNSFLDVDVWYFGLERKFYPIKVIEIIRILDRLLANVENPIIFNNASLLKYSYIKFDNYEKYKVIPFIE